MKALAAARLAAISGPARRLAAGGGIWLPLVLLLLTLATVFLFGNDRGSFYRMSHHDVISKNHLTLARNMSPEHRFLGFLYRWQDADGNITYTLYNRFPIGGYLLIKLAILPFDGNLAAQLYSARILMLLACTAAAVLAYLSLSRLTGRRWIAFTATLLTFASPLLAFLQRPDNSRGRAGFFRRNADLSWDGSVRPGGALSAAAGEKLSGPAAGLARLYPADSLYPDGIGRPTFPPLSHPFGGAAFQVPASGRRE